MVTKTSKYGVSKRESHNSCEFYGRKIFFNNNKKDIRYKDVPSAPQTAEWKDKIYHQSSVRIPLPNNSIGLSFTSPPYNVGKDYDDNLTMDEYLDLIRKVGEEIYRVLTPGGRYVINIANLGRKPYIPITSFFYKIHSEIGFLPMGEIIWQKGKGSNGSCAWGSWMSAKAPRLRDLHEYLLVFAKDSFSRLDKGVSDISKQEFMQASLSIWQIAPESALRIGHPAPFPVALAERVIRFYSYVGDTVLDPFMGSGTTCVAAKQNHRHYVGLDTKPEYCDLAQERLASVVHSSE